MLKTYSIQIPQTRASSSAHFPQIQHARSILANQLYIISERII